MARRTRWTPVRPAIDSVQEEQGTCPHDIDMEPSPHCCCGRYPWRAWHRISNRHCARRTGCGVRSRRGSSNCWMSWTAGSPRSEEHTSELQSLMRISYAVFCLKKKKKKNIKNIYNNKQPNTRRKQKSTTI